MSNGLKTPRHIAIVMDGNGRWAKRQGRPRFWGHKRGVERVRSTVEFCIEHGIEALTLFAFSTENWRRPEQEVGFLLNLFISTLEHEVEKLDRNGIRLRVIGDLDRFPERLRQLVAMAEERTRDNRRLHLNIAANYGGRWDIASAARRLCEQVQRGELQPEAVDESRLGQELLLSDLPEPELFIRTGGEQRVSNFLLWQMAYCEFYFSERYWPEFDQQALSDAVRSFGERQRRFGRTSEQVSGESS